MIVANVGKFLFGLSLVAGDAKFSTHKHGPSNILKKLKTYKDRKAVASVAAIDEDIKYCTLTSFLTTDCDGAYLGEYIQMNECVVLGGTDEGGDDFASFMWTAEETEGDGVSVWTLTYQAYEDDACESTVVDSGFLIGGTECTGSYTIDCSDSSDPWSSEGAILYSYFVDDSCDSDPYFVGATFTGTCLDQGDDGYAKGTCSGDTVDYTLYSDDECNDETDSGEMTLEESCTGVPDDDYYVDEFQPSTEGYTTSTCQKSGGDDESTCFAAHETLTLVDGEQRAISDIQVGDSVLTMTATGSYVYSEVVFVPHAANHKSATFVTLETQDGHSISMTERHLVSAGTCGAMSVDALSYVEQVQVGDCVRTVDGESRVSAVNTYRGEGVYTVVTAESNGKLVVNGVVASSFGVNHELVNSYYNIHRVLYGVFPEMMKSDKVVAVNEWLGSTMAVSI